MVKVCGKGHKQKTGTWVYTGVQVVGQNQWVRCFEVCHEACVGKAVVCCVKVGGMAQR